MNGDGDDQPGDEPAARLVVAAQEQVGGDDAAIGSTRRTSTAGTIM